nr:40S ribosomal protein S2-like [Chlorocebus sabaeus]
MADAAGGGRGAWRSWWPWDGEPRCLPRRFGQWHPGPRSRPWTGPGRGRGRGARRGKAEDKEWMPVTKLGHLINDMKIKSLEEIYLFSLPIKESEIIDFFLGASLKDEVLTFEDYAGAEADPCWPAHQVQGICCYRATLAWVSSAPRRWPPPSVGPSSWPNSPLSLCAEATGGTRSATPHCPLKVTGRCGSVLVRLIPAPRGTGIVSAPVPKKLLMMAGIDDCYTSARGCTATLGNFTKATFDAISKTYSYLIPDLWKETIFTKSPYQEFTDHLVKTHTRVSVPWTQAPAVATT